MSPSKFNSLIYASNLESAGVPKEQASIHALALADVLESHAVSKADLDASEQRGGLLFDGVNARFSQSEHNLAQTEGRLMNEITALRVELNTRIAHIEKKFDLLLEKQLTDFKKEMSDFKYDVIKWLTILSISQMGITSTVVALIVHAR
ncbi:hypothetical protein [Rugamonas sp.]|uniref:hypothetical protein n=1 Tax=Rugamonas sp. TaxID=1926287 RepID=UPI0025DA7E2A|nr:hypothetical protein [Rugamonas sp.]